MRKEVHCHNNSNSRCIQCIQWETGTTIIPNLIPLYSVYPMGNEDHCHTDSNSHCIQWIRWETRTTVIQILILTEFSVSDGKATPMSYRFLFSLYSAYRESEDHSHTDWNSDCIQCIRGKKRGHSHTDSNCHCIQCNRWETRTTVLPILILTKFIVIR